MVKSAARGIRGERRGRARGLGWITCATPVGGTCGGWVGGGAWKNGVLGGGVGG